MKLVIDRFEGEYALCESEGQEYFAIETSRLPLGAKAGCVLVLSERGELSLDMEETERRRQRIAEKQRRAFNG